MTDAEAVAADRARIAAICELPEARSQASTALKIALAGASVADAKIALAITADAYSPEQVAAQINASQDLR